MHRKFYWTFLWKSVLITLDIGHCKAIDLSEGIYIMKTCSVHRRTAGKYIFLLCLTALILAVPVFSSPARAEGTASSNVTADAIASSGGKWITTGGKLKYRFSNKTYARNGFYKIGKYWYHFDSQGYLSTGWFTVNNQKYYAAKTGSAGKKGHLYSGWHTFKGKTYYFSVQNKKGTFGKMFTGWKTFQKKTYYFGNDGVLRTGWRKINGKYFYFLPKGTNGTKGSMVTGWYTISGKKYYFRTTGKAGVRGARYKSEWRTINGSTYYFTQDGVLSTEYMSQSQFIDYIGKLAQKDMKKSGILASVTTAQAILESGYCSSTLALEAHNLFGMKATLSGNTWRSDWDGKTYTKITREYVDGKWITIKDTFRAYSSFADSLADHSNYLAYAKNGSNLRYQGVVGNKSYKKTLQIIKNGGYATDPQYVTKLCSLIKKYNLTKYDK